MKTLTLALLSTLWLSACGFSPVHSTPANSKATFQNIDVKLIETTKTISNEGGFYIQQRLRDRLGTSGDLYTLEITPGLSAGRLGISARDIASRYDYTLTSNYRLLDTKTGAVLTKGTVSTVSTFGAPVDPYGLEITQTNSTRAIASDNADRLIGKLAAYFASLDP